ncbi:MAG: sensor histidine kinase [Nocardiopsaceae bacterium]|nr:sensor histidine kinase [Nocardiopsaceae bacterium]
MLLLPERMRGAAPDDAGPRIGRGLGAGVWLVYLAVPLGSVFGSGHSVWYSAGVIALSAVFAAIYLALMVLWVPGREGRPRMAQPGFAVLFAIALTTSVVYGGYGVTMWIFMSAAAAWMIRDRRQALRAIVLVIACYVIFAWTSRLGATDFLTALLPTVIVGPAVLGLRRRMELTRQLTQAREEVEQMAAAAERLRLARDMHDLTGQSLSTITLKSELAARLVARLPPGPERDRAAGEIEQVAEVSRQALRDIRQALSGYRRPTLAVEAITARGALESAGIASRDDAALTMMSGTFDPDAEAALAWCLREAVTNVVRHSGARHCHIGLTRDPDSVRLDVRDDGRGQAGPDVTGGTGLRGMSERLTAVGGHLELRPSPGGFALTASVPARGRVTVTS